MTFFDTIVKRVANFSVQSYDRNKNNINDFFNSNELFQLSILTSSKPLFEDIKKGKSLKIEESLAKYFFRAHFNPTPFGFFNSVGIVQWGDSNLIKKGTALSVSVNYDNQFLSSKIKEEIIGEWFNKTYCINPSIYFLNNDKISFYKSKIEINGRIEINHVEIDFDEDLKWLIDRINSSGKIELLIQELIQDGFTRNDIDSYLLQTIDIGLLIETYIFNPYADKLAKGYKSYPTVLIQKKLHELTNKNDIIKFSTAYIEEQKNFFNKGENERNSHSINCFDNEIGTLDKNIQDKIKRYIDFTINYNSHNTPYNLKLDKFIGKLSSQFNDGFIPLNTIFNPYSGLSYTSIQTDFKMKLHNDIFGKILSSTDKQIVLDLPIKNDVSKKSHKLPGTFSTFIEILVCKSTGDKIIYAKQLGETSALNFISRFGKINNDLCQDIVNYEKEIHKNKIIADINCVANLRSVNIAPIKQFYDNCVPINTSISDSSNPILISDIYLHLRDGSISLMSKKNKKQILPRKTSAVNSKLLNSEIYSFLCDFEYYREEIYAVNFDFNAYNYFIPFVPRIYLEKDVLLHPAQILLVDKNYNFEEFKVYLASKINEYSFTTKFILSDRTQGLTIDSGRESDLLLVYKKIKSRKSFYITEFIYELFIPEAQGNAENFIHELVLSVKNTDYKREDIIYDDQNIASDEVNNIPILSDWLYLDLFCNSYADNTILMHIYNEIILESKSDSFFFVHYSNPDRHLRLRFKTASIENKQYIISIVQDLKSRKIISKYQISPYIPEIHRYGGVKLMNIAQKIFSIDTENLLKTIINTDLGDNDISIISILKIKYYLSFFGFSLDEMIVFCEKSIAGFSNEFELTAELRKDFNKAYANIKFEINSYHYDDFLNDKSFQNDFKEELSKAKIDIFPYAWLVIHMSMNRQFNSNQRFHEFKSYYVTKCYLNQLKFTNKS